MPRIRDLGISHIPLTMRPPEIGAGAAFDMTAAPDAFPMFMNTQTCNQSCVTNSGGQCVPSGCPNSCPGNSCPGNSCPGNSCPGNSCAGDSGRGGDYHLGGLEREAILELKQHLQDRIGSQLQM